MICYNIAYQLIGMSQSVELSYITVSRRRLRNAVFTSGPRTRSLGILGVPDAVTEMIS